MSIILISCYCSNNYFLKETPAPVTKSEKGKTWYIKQYLNYQFKKRLNFFLYQMSKVHVV